MVPQVEPTTFTTQDGIRLEGELRMPQGTPLGSAVICHPHPRQGGSKDHPILWAIRNELAGRRGLATLSFNFRGVMGSGGTYGGGRDEIRDVRAAIDLLRSRVDGPVVSCGWSFGANVALREALEDDRPAALALIGIPLQPGDQTLPALPTAAELRTLKRPLLFMAGERDQYCPPGELRDYAAASGGSVSVLEDTDHFLWRREREAAGIAGEFLAGVLASS